MPEFVKRRGRSAVSFAVEGLEQRRMLSRAPILLPYSALANFLGTPADSQLTQVTTGVTAQVVATQPTGALTGRIVYTSGGHGYTWEGSSWVTGRPLLNGMIEDMGNQDQMSYYADYALQAGATVVPMRPVGHQTNEVVVDNSDVPASAGAQGFSIVSGSWSSSTGSPYWSNNNGNDTAHYVFANGTGNANSETAVARFTANIPATGFYPVYTWYRPFSDRNSSATFRVNYAGGSTEVKVNQAWTGNGWVYLGTYYFTAGTSGNVEVSNKSGSTGATIADAVRWGNGMGDFTTEYTYTFNSTTGTYSTATATIIKSGQSREDEASLYWLYRSRGYTGVGTQEDTALVDGHLNLDSDKNVGAAAKWAAHMNLAPFGQSVYLGFHSNAGNTTTRGTLGLYNNESLFPGTATPNQTAWAAIIGHEVNDEMSALTAPPLEATWFNQGTTDASVTYARDDYAFGEIRSSATGDEFDATIVEVAYHDNVTDAHLLEDPKVREDIARASVHATVKYFDQFGGLANSTFLPDRPTSVRSITDASGNVTISWTPPATGASVGNAGAATSYRVYTSTNGYGFDAGTATAGTSLTFTGLPSGAMTYFRVAADNAGGESLPSAEVTVKPQLFRRAPILIVNNFARLDRFGDQVRNGSRPNNRYNNSMDYVVQAAEAIKSFNPNLGVESCTDADIASGAVNLNNYQAVIWMSGEQSSADKTFTTTTQPLVATYLANGGKMFISSAEIGFELVSQGHGASFYQNTLHTNYVADDANTYVTGAGIVGKALASVPALNFDNGTHGTYDVDFPDIISAGTNASIAMNYSGGSGGAAVVQYSSGSTQIINMGFPFESIYTASQRNSLMAAVLTFFGTTTTLVTAASSTPDLVAASDTGSSNSDNVTRLNNSSGKLLQFTVNGVTSGAAVTLYSSGTTLASGTATGSSITLTTNGTFTLSDGVRSITARQQFPGFTQSADSSALSVLIDTVAPTASIAAVSPSPRDSAVSSIGVNFSEPVSGFDRADLSLTRDGGANLLTSSQTVSGSGSTYSLDNLGFITTPTGSYHLTLDNGGSGIADAAGNGLLSSTSTDFAVGVITGDATPNANDTFRVAPAGGGQVAVFINNNTGTPDYQWTIAGGQSLVINGGGGDDTLIIQGPLPANVVFNGGTGADAIDVQSGTYTFTTDATAGSASLSVSAEAGGNVVFNATQHLATLALNGGTATLASGGNKALVTSALSISNGGQLDLTNNSLIVNYTGASPVATIRAFLASAFNAGNWNGAGIASSAASGDANQLTALGYAENSDLGYATFAGQSVGSNSLLVKYTYYGDGNLDGVVDIGNDFSLFLDGYTAHGSAWKDGDYTYDGTIDLGNDFNLLNSALNTQGPPL